MLLIPNLSTMKKKDIFEARVTVQGAQIRPAALHTVRLNHWNPFVRILVMVPKGDKDVTVATNCETEVKRRTHSPLWNETFAIPVLPSSDVLVFRVHNLSAEAAETAGLSAAPPATARASLESTASSAGSVHLPAKSVIGVCLLPVAHFDASGEATRHALDIFPRPDKPPVGRLYVAAQIRRTSINLLEKEDLEDPILRKQYHSSRLSAVTARFLGIGELAAFLFEEGYSAEMEANWDRALTLLAEQLAYRIWETTESTDDQVNLLYAKKKIEKDGGLWDGV